MIFWCSSICIFEQDFKQKCKSVCFFGDCGAGPNEILCEEKEIILRSDRGLNIPCLHRGGGGGSSRGPEFLFSFLFLPSGTDCTFLSLLMFCKLI